MTLPFVIGYDATHANIAHLPKGQAAGYTTGSPDIKWTPQDWAAHPGAIRYDQDGTASDHTADILDVERGAATNTEAAAWIRAAQASYLTVKRPGQRQAAIYTSASNVTPLVNALTAAGVKTGVHLIVANWSDTQAQAISIVEAAAGPFPIAGVQYTDSPRFYDIAVYSSSWVNTVSRVAAPLNAGPYRHITSLGRTITHLAATRTETIPQLITNSAKHYTAADLAELEHALAHWPLPAGIPWYTDKP